MRPIKLNLTNFGPFLNETIDFNNVENNQLFLISGKTGSGKTMIFDAIVFALFGEASTKDRKESDLRSHFAESKKAMVVEFEFKLRNQYFKIQRQGAFIKEGNKNKTLGQLAVYQYEQDDYALRESKINSGNQFIKALLGVNAEQFRQLFILPQGEFKRFLLSKSVEKQDILRTLFNSQRFEEIQKKLSDDVKEVREQIEKRYNDLENHWKELETFDDETLCEHKVISARQTNNIIKVLPDFKMKAQIIRDDFEQKKEILKNKVNSTENALNNNIKLEDALNKLNENQQKYEALLVNEHEIQEKVKRVTEINEVRPITNLLEVKENTISKKGKVAQSIEEKSKSIFDLEDKIKQSNLEADNLKEKQDDIEELRRFIEETQLFFEKANKYKDAYNNYQFTKTAFTDLEAYLTQKNEEIKDTTAKLNQRQPDYRKIEQITEAIYNLNNDIKQLKQNEKDKIEYDALQKRKMQKQRNLKDLSQKRVQLNEEYNNIDKSKLDLNNKQDVIATVQAALHTGETCPICGNEIHTLSSHVDFDEIMERHQQLTLLEEKIATVKGDIIKCESELSHIEEQLSKYTIASLENINYEAIEDEVEKKYQEKKKIDEENNEIEKLKDQLQQYEKSSHDLQMNIQKKEHILKENETAINDFENTTGYKRVDEFLTKFEDAYNQIRQFDQTLNEIEQKIQNYKSTLAIEKNSITYLKNNLAEIETEINETDMKINEEMQRIGFTSLEQVEKVTAQASEKQNLEKEIETFKKEKQSYELYIAQLKAETNNKKLDDTQQLKERFEEMQQAYETASTELSQHDYKMEFNSKKTTEINKIIDELNSELQSQQEVFQLAEILAGKNEQKLTLENYVLIYYLERILTQANQRLAIMTGQRYQLTRRAQISQGYSGLEIDVFDAHSNQSRHITSLSGGETFQASLALALGLSEIVQQESGGISLDSMFVDEGFGTLDQETLETALDTLLSLKSTGRMVGIISHVSELKQRIPLILEVTTEQYQSTTHFKKQ
ncbi:exonuclease subunit SbcC [Staphylococcus saprophyticus]|uniref:exonuclease subunit SbcC n=1 Tax=Staphylococcus saprophyticus TaxID=29385 RepID=UPI001D179871|nr:exonuclease subunit SbcC [Staphylococcus saprophyticus]MCC4219892.1 SMC family ATPase [Staphylococcus saprophyticus]